MSREIKFRAWIPVENRMETPATIGSNQLHTNTVDSIFGQGGKVFMQFTGLKDKNGKDIYFDDILKVEIYDEESDVWNTGTVLVVETLNKGAGILFDLVDEGNSYDIHAVSEGGIVEELWEDGDLFKVEVIGNIYENPELLNN